MTPAASIMLPTFIIRAQVELANIKAKLVHWVMPWQANWHLYSVSWTVGAATEVNVATLVLVIMQP